MEVDRLVGQWQARVATGPVSEEALEQDGRLLNYHARLVAGPAAELYARLARMGTALDDAWPLTSVPMKSELNLQPGLRAGHGPIAYELVAFEEPSRIEWRFTMERLQGRYEYTLTPRDGATLVENVIDGRVSGDMIEAWREAVGPFHDWVIERIFDRLERPPAPWFDARFLRAIK